MDRGPFSAAGQRHSACVVALLSTCALFIASPVSAQNSQAQDGQVQPISQPAAASSSTLDINFDVTAGYTDNVFATRHHEVDDFLTILRPSARWTLVDGKHRLVVRGEGKIGRYGDNKSENYNDWLVGLDGRIQASPNLTLIGGGEHQWEHESRSSPDAENGLEPTRFERLYMFGGAIARAGKFTIRPAIQLNRYDFHDVETAGQPINNEDRDRVQVELGARLAYSIADSTDLFVQGAWDRRDYDSPTDDFGYRRDSKGGSIVAGIRETFSPSLSAEIFGGYLGQNYDDPRLKDVHTVDAGTLVNWSNRRGMAITFRADRSVEETTLPGASSYLLTSGSLAFNLTPGPRMQAGLTLAGSKYDYRGYPRSEFVASGDLWLRYWLSSRIYAGLSYSLSQRTSNPAGFDYDENRLMLRLGADLRPRDMVSKDEMDFDGKAPAGLYAGLFGAHGTLVTGLEGPRGARHEYG